MILLSKQIYTRGPLTHRVTYSIPPYPIRRSMLLTWVVLPFAIFDCLSFLIYLLSSYLLFPFQYLVAPFLILSDLSYSGLSCAILSYFHWPCLLYLYKPKWKLACAWHRKPDNLQIWSGSVEKKHHAHPPRGKAGLRPFMDYLWAGVEGSCGLGSYSLVASTYQRWPHYTVKHIRIGRWWLPSSESSPGRPPMVA